MTEKLVLLQTGEKKEFNCGIRYGKTVKEYINKFPGEGFNQKFECLVLHCLKDEEDRKKRIAELEKKEKQLRENIKNLVEKAELAAKIGMDIDNVKRLLSTIQSNAEKLLDMNEK